jgi:formyltetrahydrofolate hydrolase
LLPDCPNRRGIVVSVRPISVPRRAHILHSEQHEDNKAGKFLMRVEAL